MSAAFWLRRFLVALLVATVLLFGVQLLKAHPVAAAAAFALLWGVASAALFTLTGYVRYKRNPACMLPRSRQP